MSDLPRNSSIAPDLASERYADGTSAPRYQQLESFQVPPGFRGQSTIYVQMWRLVQSTLFALSPQFMYGWRAWLLRRFGARIGEGVIIRPSVKIPYPWKLTIGNHCHIGDEVHLYTYGEIEIGDCAVVSQRSYLCAGSHDYKSPAFDLIARKIVIESEVWVATDVFVAPGVTIGHGAVVGARSSVFHDLPPGTISIGTPAKVVGERRMRAGSQ
jgi:putative colanic acid biosynthesis acetyltransferase WcaF